MHFKINLGLMRRGPRLEGSVSVILHPTKHYCNNIDAVAYDSFLHRDNMSTVKRRRGESLHLELPKDGREEKPPIEALFLIQFDARKG